MLKQLVQRQLSLSSTHLFTTASHSPLSIIEQLARKIDDIKHERARACVIWLVGQYASSNEASRGPEGLVDWAPDVLRISARLFPQAEPLVKLQTVTLAAKLFALSPNDTKISQLTKYIFSLARYDLDYDVRDRGRMLSSLLSGMGLQVDGTTIEERGGVILRREQVRMVLFEGKIVASDERSCVSGVSLYLRHVFAYRDFIDNANILLGSSSAITGKSARMDDVLPKWLEKGVASSTRDSEYDTSAPIPIASIASKPVATSIVLTPTGQRTEILSGKAPYKDLDTFYAEEQSSDEEEDEEDQDQEDDQEDEDQDEDEEDDRGDEDEEEEDEEEEDEENHGTEAEEKRKLSDVDSKEPVEEENISESIEHVR